MKDHDKPKFSALLSDALAFYGKDVSSFALTVWWQACQPFTFEQVSKALTAHALDPERGHFPPKPADLVRVLQGTHTDRSLFAWGKLYGAMASVGAYQSVAFDDAAIHLAVEDLGGWVQVCRMPVDELPFLQKRFCDAYRAHAARPGTPHPARLIGESEAVNLAAKLTSEQVEQVGKTVLIGDEQAARHVVATGGPRRHGMTTLLGAVPAMPRLETAA